MPFDNENIRVLALAAIKNGDKFLAGLCEDKLKGIKFYRFIGGGVDFGEHARETLKREFLEELGIDIEVKEQIGVLENIFVYNGNKGHEVIFVFNAEFKDKSLYEKEEFEMLEDDKYLKITWADISSENVIFPEGIDKILI